VTLARTINNGHVLVNFKGWAASYVGCSHKPRAAAILDDARALTQLDCAARPPLTVNMSCAGPLARHAARNRMSSYTRRMAWTDGLICASVESGGLVQLLLRGIARCLAAV
jgi:hypothetical protein